MATIAAGSSGAEGRLGHLAGIVAASVLILWIAHVYAHALGESVGLGRRLDSAEFRAVARRELSMPLAAVLPVGALVLGTVGILEERTAVLLALGIGVGALGAQSLRYARVERLGRGGTVVSFAVNITLGLVIVALEVLLAH